MKRFELFPEYESSSIMPNWNSAAQLAKVALYNELFPRLKNRWLTDLDERLSFFSGKKVHLFQNDEAGTLEGKGLVLWWINYISGMHSKQGFYVLLCVEGKDVFSVLGITNFLHDQRTVAFLRDMKNWDIPKAV